MTNLVVIFLQLPAPLSRGLKELIGVVCTAPPLRYCPCARRGGVRCFGRCAHGARVHSAYFSFIWIRASILLSVMLFFVYVLQGHENAWVEPLPMVLS